MTRRGTALLLAPMALVGAGAAVPALLIVGLVIAIAGAALIAVDSRRAPGRRRLRVERTHDEILSVGSANRVVITVDGRASARARVRDEVPASLHPSAVTWRLDIPGVVEYTVTPRARGIEQLGRVIVRAEGPMRLGWRQTAYGHVARDVSVEADLSSVRAYEALARRGQLAELGVRTLR